jgi:hypothetical protein
MQHLLLNSRVFDAEKVGETAHGHHARAAGDGRLPALAAVADSWSSRPPGACSTAPAAGGTLAMPMTVLLEPYAEAARTQR